MTYGSIVTFTNHDTNSFSKIYLKDDIFKYHLVLPTGVPHASIIKKYVWEMGKRNFRET